MNRCDAIRIAVFSLLSWCQIGVEGQQMIPRGTAATSRSLMRFVPTVRPPSNAFVSNAFPTQPTATNEAYLSSMMPNYPPFGQFSASPTLTTNGFAYQQIPSIVASNGRQPFPNQSTNVLDSNYRNRLSNTPSNVAGQLYSSGQNEMTVQNRKARQQQQLGNYLNALYFQLHPEGFRIEGNVNSGTTVTQTHNSYWNPIKRKFDAVTNLVSSMMNSNKWASLTGDLPIVNNPVNLGLNVLDSGLGVIRRIR